MHGVEQSRWDIAIHPGGANRNAVKTALCRIHAEKLNHG
jgi:hypothetical protein